MKTKFAAAFFAILSVGVVGGACNTDGDLDEELDELEDAGAGELEATDPDTTFFTRTQVTELPDGTFEVVQEKVSLAQQIAEREAEEAGLTLEELYASAPIVSDVDGKFTPALSKPASCISTGYLRMWANTNYVGNQLCLTGTGTSALHAWSNCITSPAGTFCSFWGTGSPFGPDIPVRSYKSGNTSVRFTDAAGDNYTECAWANQNISQPNFAGSSWASYVGREVFCPPE